MLRAGRPILRFLLAKGGKPIPSAFRAECRQPQRSWFADYYLTLAHNGR